MRFRHRFGRGRPHALRVIYGAVLLSGCRSRRDRDQPCRQQNEGYLHGSHDGTSLVSRCELGQLATTIFPDIEGARILIALQLQAHVVRRRNEFQRVAIRVIDPR